MPNTGDIIIQKAKAILDRLTSRPIIGGLLISDSLLEYLVLGVSPKGASLKIPPGVFRDGKIIDQEQFVALLKQLHSIIDAENRERSMSVIAVLPAGTVYSQGLQVPNIGADKLEESAYLNLRMISPIPADTAYMSYQIINETPDKFDLLGAIVERSYIEEMRTALIRGGFSPIVFEFPGLALARAVGEYLPKNNRASVLFQITGDGLELSIVRGDGLYFDYFRSWHSIQGEERQISRALFENVVAQEIQKVLNFGLSRFKESIGDIFLIAPGFEEEVKGFVETRFGVTVTPLVLSGIELAPNWYAVLGAAMRGNIDRSSDRFITLSNISSVESFREEQIINFVVLWRNIIVSVLGIFLILFGGISYFIGSEAKSVQGNLALFNTAGQKQKLSNLEKLAGEFNALVKTVADVRGTAEPWGLFLSRIIPITQAHQVGIDRIDELGSFTGATVTLGARTVSYDLITNFKAALSAEPDFSNVDLSISRITTLEDGSIGFILTFNFDPTKSPKS
ncbi:MAG: hypothetical protein Q7R98_02225 [Candidatus Jorgensenbacteria bacterium]|nr:hypothetical protein [Candidatus Jorgensenbacteria bacterium]